MPAIRIDLGACTGCRKCAELCPANVLAVKEKKAVVVNEAACTLCGICADQCPKQAITLERKADIGKYLRDFRAKDEYCEANGALSEILELRKSPVAIRLVRQPEDVPSEVMPLDFPVRHCVSINMAAHGAVFYLPASRHACSAAKAALGIEPLPEKVRNGKVPYMHGLAASQESAARTMAEIPKLPQRSAIGTLLAPLDKAPFEPDVVVLTVTPKQAMWVSIALLFKDGGPRLTASFAGMQASCGDVTALPMLSGKVNFSLGCYGCRSEGKLGEDEMYVGIPIGQLAGVASGLKGLRKAMRNLEKGKE
jgi:uncharacterized protein (DUF169 family)/NAD-dependent dihydropyrimidine dehydrogenase PreA subunit